MPSNDFYPALAQPNVSLVTEKIIGLRPDAVVTADGTEHTVDTMVLATGFHVTDNPMFGKITGADGRTLADAFGQTYLGTVLPGFPLQLVPGCRRPQPDAVAGVYLRLPAPHPDLPDR